MNYCTNNGRIVSYAKINNLCWMALITLISTCELLMYQMPCHVWHVMSHISCITCHVMFHMSYLRCMSCHFSPSLSCYASHVRSCFTCYIMPCLTCLSCHVSSCLPCHVSPCIMSYHVSHVMFQHVLHFMSCLTSHHVSHVRSCLICHISSCFTSCHVSYVMFQHVLHIMSCLTYHHISQVRSSLICHVSPCFMSWINDRYMMIEPTSSKESSFLDCRFPVIMYLGLADQLSCTKQHNPQAWISTMSGLMSIPPFGASWPQIDMLFSFHFCHSWFLSWQII